MQSLWKRVAFIGDQPECLLSQLVLIRKHYGPIEPDLLLRPIALQGWHLDPQNTFPRIKSTNLMKSAASRSWSQFFARYLADIQSHEYTSTFITLRYSSDVVGIRASDDLVQRGSCWFIQFSLFCLQCQIVRSGCFRFQGPMFLLDSLDHGLPLMCLKNPELIQHFASPASSTSFTTNSLTISHAPTWPMCLGPPPCLFLLSPCSPPCSLSLCALLLALLLACLLALLLFCLEVWLITLKGSMLEVEN